jgi:hypothetical protein
MSFYALMSSGWSACLPRTGRLPTSPSSWRIAGGSWTSVTRSSTATCVRYSSRKRAGN